MTQTSDAMGSLASIKPAIRMEQLIRCMMDRMDFSVGRKILRYLGLRPSHGWLGTIENISDAIKSGAIGTKEVLRLQAMYREHIAHGDKYVRFYDVEEKVVGSFYSNIAEMEVEESVFSRSFPYSVTGKELASVEANTPILCSIEKFSSGIALIYSSNREHQIRERIDTDSMSAVVSKAFEGYAQVIGVKAIRKQAFDVIWVPNNGGPIEIRVDAQACHFFDIATATHEVLRQEFNNLVKKNVLGKPLNLFSAIKNLYDEEGEGGVVEMAFMAGTASHKHETMRKSRTCLRKEKFHEAGVVALDGDIHPHLISIVWSYPFTVDHVSYPELDLRGAYRIVDQLEPTVYDAHIRRAWGFADFDMVRDKVLTYFESHDSV